MRILRIFIIASALAGLAVAQQPSPSPSPTTSPTPIFTPTPTATPSPSASPTPTPRRLPTETPTPTPSPNPTPLGGTPGATPSPTPSAVLLSLFAQSATPSQAPPAAPAPTVTEPRNTGEGNEPPRPSYPDLISRFDYDSKSGLELRETNIEKRDGIMLIELNYAGNSGDRVPAYLVLPHGGDNHPAIIWGHWLKQGSPLANKDEFLEEALILARAGAVSLLIDAPQARYDYGKVEKDPLEAAKQQSDASLHQVIDLRRAVDLLLNRRDVDRKRIAYVGHSWDAHVGAILAGVESRICCFVLMASGYFDEEDTFSGRDPEATAHVKQIGEDRVRDYFREYAYDDPVYFLGHTNSESIFLQFAASDHPPSVSPAAYKAQAQRYLDAFSSKDKQMTIYDAPHALNSTARIDRYRWLQKHLGLKKIDEKDLEAIPQLK